MRSQASKDAKLKSNPKLFPWRAIKGLVTGPQGSDDRTSCAAGRCTDAGAYTSPAGVDTEFIFIAAASPCARANTCAHSCAHCGADCCVAQTMLVFHKLHDANVRFLYGLLAARVL